MIELAKEVNNLRNYFFYTGEDQTHDLGEVVKGRMSEDFISEIVTGQRLFCIYGSPPLVESVVNRLVDCGVWPGCIRSDYTTRLDGAIQRKTLETCASENVLSSYRPKFKGQEVAKEEFITQYGIDSVLETMMD
jgi:hypothetical protein